PLPGENFGHRSLIWPGDGVWSPRPTPVKAGMADGARIDVTRGPGPRCCFRRPPATSIGLDLIGDDRPTRDGAGEGDDARAEAPTGCRPVGKPEGAVPGPCWTRSAADRRLPGRPAVPLARIADVRPPLSCPR